MVNDEKWVYQSSLVPMNVPSIHFEWLKWTCQYVGRRINVRYREDWCYESTRLLFCNAVIANPVFLQICNLRLNISWMWSWILQTSPLWTTSGTSWAMSALFRLCMASWISQTSMSPQVRTELTQLRPSYCRTSFRVSSIHCSRVPRQCSERVLAPSNTTTTPSVICPHVGLNQKPSASLPSPQTDWADFVQVTGHHNTVFFQIAL